MTAPQSEPRVPSSSSLSEARYRAIVEDLPDLICRFLPDGTVTFANEAYCGFFGLNRDALIGQCYNPVVVPEDLPRVLAEVATLSPGNPVVVIENRVIRGDGEVRWTQWTNRGIYEDGRLVELQSAGRDITERKRHEQELEERDRRFQLMADQAPVLIWVSDTANRGIFFNKPWLDFTGMPLEAQVGEGWLAAIHPDDRPVAGEYCQRHFERREPFTMEFRLRHHSGDHRWVQDTGQPLFLPDGTFNGYVGSCVDIDVRKRLEEAREEAVRRETEARAAAEEASRLKDEFLAVVSHELRTPLNAILGWVQMLRNGSLPPEAAPKALDTVERNARMQVQLVEDLLDVSRIVTGKLALRREPVEMRGVIEAAIDAVRPAVLDKQVEVGLDAGEPVLVTGDGGRLQQAVWNLLTNAVKFTPKGGRIGVDLRQERTEAVIAVRDSGSGIPPDALPFIFDRFRQADSRITRAHRGLGLGLTIVSHVAQAHGGRVMAESAGPGAGSTFTIRLPAGVEATVDASADAAERPDLSGRRVLVVEDEEDVRELLRTLLEACGASVIAAGSVAEALAALRGITPPDVLIGDIGMPEQDGFDLIRAVRALPGLAKTPAVALTAFAASQHREAALEAGYDRYLLKPADPPTIWRTVAELCEKS